MNVQITNVKIKKNNKNKIKISCCQKKTEKKKITIKMLGESKGKQHRRRWSEDVTKSARQ